MSHQPDPVRRIMLPSNELEMVDRKYTIKEFVDRERPGRNSDQKLVLDFAIYRLLVDNARKMIADKMGAELSSDPGMIVKVVLMLLLNEELLTEHVYTEANSVPTDPSEWELIRETFAWRLLGRYNRELLREIGDEGGETNGNQEA